MNLAQLFSTPTASRQGLSNNFLSSLGATRTGEGALLPGQGGLSFSPTQNTTTPSPIFDWNNNPDAARAAAQMGGAMGAGWLREGVNAFLPGDINFFDLGGDNWKAVTAGETDVVNPEQADYRQSMVDGLSNLAKQFGYDISGYDLTQGGTATDQFGMNAESARNQANAREKLMEIDPNLAHLMYGVQGPKGLSDLYLDLNKDLSNFQRIRGASAGWDGKGNMRSTSEAMYYQIEPGKWVPISNPVSDVKREHKGWAREEGAETLAALSMVLPAFGGWAGLLGQGTAGTLSAGAGMGLTTGLGSIIGNGLANTVVNSVMNGLMSGGNPQSLLSSLALGTAGKGLTGALGGKSLSDIFGGGLPTDTGTYSSLQDFMRSGTGQAVQRMPAFRASGGAGLNQLLQGGSRLANTLGA